MVQLIGSSLIIVAVVMLTACTVVYGTQFRWWHDSTGRHLFAFMAVFALAIWLWSWRLITAGQLQTVGEAGLWPEIRLAMFALIDWVLGWRLLIIIRALPGERRRRKQNKEAEHE